MKPKITTVSIQGTNVNSFRPGVWADVIGIKMVEAVDFKERLCFECRYPDGYIDYIPLSDEENYNIAPF